MSLNEKYWTDRYAKGAIQWDVGEVTTPIKEYIDQMSDKTLKILIPGAGNAHEAEYLWKQGFKNVYLSDISLLPLQNFSKRNPSFPDDHLLYGDFFDVDQQFDIIIEQTFFCALNPKRRIDYVKKCSELLVADGRIVGVLFNDTFSDGPPYGGSREEYINYFEKYFDLLVFDACYNSIKSRSGRELFINCVKSR